MYALLSEHTAQVEQLLLKAEGAHEAFRLWVTAEPHPAFPIGLLQMGIKITNEAPVGIRAGLRASYQWVTQVRRSHHRSPNPQCRIGNHGSAIACQTKCTTSFGYHYVNGSLS